MNDDKWLETEDGKAYTWLKENLCPDEIYGDLEAMHFERLCGTPKKEAYAELLERRMRDIFPPEHEYYGEGCSPYETAVDEYLEHFFSGQGELVKEMKLWRRDGKEETEANL